MARSFKVVQPWGRDRGREATIISEHASALEAFAALDALAERMAQTGAQSDAIALLVVDVAGNQVARPGAHRGLSRDCTIGSVSLTFASTRERPPRAVAGARSLSAQN
jgi:hypothetical protein